MTMVKYKISIDYLSNVTYLYIQRPGAVRISDGGYTRYGAGSKVWNMWMILNGGSNTRGKSI